MATVRALLGPTNTGKTHRAITRMLEHPTGAIALPLRLLAREVFERVAGEVGRGRVALVTGEERILPRGRPDYVVSTTEAMPTRAASPGHDAFDFVAIDEVQLVAHGERGHVFTERLLDARGARETWLLGARTAAGLVSALVPTATVEEAPRLSRLSHAGAHKLSALPPRSAVVAFSMAQVHELGERLRHKRGGAALVTGAFSPRTRNAQVAMFEAGEVDYLVATDAIGMGLNLRVRHVAFAGLRKFDGREARALDDAELAQIAGRAGRWIEDGTFGTLAPLVLPAGAVHAIETSALAPLRRARWRNARLELDDLDALLASLRVAPPHPRLELARGADDELALVALAERPEVRARARGRDAVSLLWDVCRVPDYRKLLPEVHAGLLRELYVRLVDGGGRLPTDFVAERLRDAAPGREAEDVDALVARLARLRTWAYVANQEAWVDGAELRAEAATIEDGLSDRLHEALVARYVASRRKARPLPAGPRPRAAPSSSLAAPSSFGASSAGGVGRARADGTEARVPAGHPFAALATLRLPGAPPPPLDPDDGDALRALAALAELPHEALSLGDDLLVRAGDTAFGRLARSADPHRPVACLALDPAPPAGVRSRLERRLVAYAKDLVGELLGGARGLESADSPELRAVGHALRLGLGCARVAPELDDAARRNLAEKLAARGVEGGGRSWFLRASLQPDGLALRRRLVAATLPPGAALPRPAGDSTDELGVGRHVRASTLLALGYVRVGGRALRVDLAEEAA